MRRTARAVSLALVLVAMRPPSFAQSRPAIERVFLLTAGERASVVVETGHEVERTAVAEGTPGVFVVDLGAMRGPVRTQRFRAVTPHLVREVTILGASTPGSPAAVRVRVDLAEAAAGSVRVAGKRVYLDFAPPHASARQAGRSSDADPGPRFGSDGLRGPGPTAPPAAARALPVGDRAAPTPDRSAAAATLLDRVETLALRPDVKGIERLRAQWLADAPTSETDDGDETLARLDAFLEEARRIQLREDARRLRALENR
jgi:hypothetical protein